MVMSRKRFNRLLSHVKKQIAKENRKQAKVRAESLLIFSMISREKCTPFLQSDYLLRTFHIENLDVWRLLQQSIISIKEGRRRKEEERG